MTGHFAISKSCKYSLIISLVLFLAILLARFDLGESFALWSHIRYGFRGHCCGIEVKVPLRYWATEERPDSLSLHNTPGYLRFRLFHSPHASILVSKHSTPFDEGQVRQATERLIVLWTRQGYRLVGTKAIQVTGYSMNCAELYTEHFSIFGPDYNVWCTEKDITAEFSGSPALLGEFYTVLEGATPTIEVSQITKQ